MREKTPWKSNTYKIYIGKSVDFLHRKLNAINTFYNFYFYYWELITKLCPGSFNRNTSFTESNNILFQGNYVGLFQWVSVKKKEVQEEWNLIS